MIFVFDNAPPKPSPENTLQHAGIVALADISLVILFDGFRGADIDGVRIVDFPKKISVKLYFIFGFSNYFIRHPKDKMILLVGWFSNL